MEQFNLEVCFKGDRNYIQSTDIFNEIMKNLIKLGYDVERCLELNFRSVARRNMVCSLSPVKRRNSNEVLNFKLGDKSNVVFGSVLEVDNQDSISRITFDDADVVERCTFDSSTRSITFKPVFGEEYKPVMDVVVAAGRSLLLNNVDSSVNWFIRSLTFEKNVLDLRYQNLMLQIGQFKSGLVKVNIIVDQVYVGYSLGAPIKI